MKPDYNKAPLWLRILCTALSMLLLLSSCAPVISAARDVDECVETYPTESIEEQTNEETSKEETNKLQPLTIPEIPQTFNLDGVVTIHDVENCIEECRQLLYELHLLMISTDKNHYQYSDLVTKYDRVSRYKEMYERTLENHWNKRAQQLPVMTYIWKYLSTTEFNEHVTAGIIGNMIAEAGGCGYGDINPHADNGGHYGVCQWSKRFYPSVIKQDLDFQLNFLIETYSKTFENYGYLYSSRYGSKFGTEEFLALEDPSSAAIAFGLCYERPGGGVTIRGKYAKMAYEYFTVINSWPWYGPEP